MSAQMERAMKTYIDRYQNCLCLVIETPNQEQPGSGNRRSWYPVRQATPGETHILTGRSVTQVDPLEGVYVDEEGNVFQLADKGETKPIAVEHLPEGEKTELEVLLEASLKGRKGNEQNGGPKRLLKKMRSGGRKQQALQMVTAKPEARPAEAPAAVETSASTLNVPSPEDLVRLNLRQKLAE